MTVTVSGLPEAKEGEQVTLTASLKPAAQGARWQWEKKDGQTFVAIPGETSAVFRVDVTEDARGPYRAVATVAGTPDRSPEITLKIKDKAPAPEKPKEPVEVPPKFHPWFAGCVAVPAILLGLWFVADTDWLSTHLGLNETEFKLLDGRTIVSTRMLGPIAALGVVLVIVGATMTLIEWRGRFAEEPATEDGTPRGVSDVDPVKLVEAIGKLKGATLIVVAGLVILLGVAWMTSSTAAPPPSSPSPPGTTKPG